MISEGKRNIREKRYEEMFRRRRKVETKRGQRGC
jgi:hypothetical protein